MLIFALLLSTALAGAWAWRLWRELRAGLASFAGGVEVERATSPGSYWMVIGGNSVVLLIWLVATLVLLLALMEIG
jgi:hypothetical protein